MYALETKKGKENGRQSSDRGLFFVCAMSLKEVNHRQTCWNQNKVEAQSCSVHAKTESLTNNNQVFG